MDEVKVKTAPLKGSRQILRAGPELSRRDILKLSSSCVLAAILGDPLSRVILRPGAKRAILDRSRGDFRMVIKKASAFWRGRWGTPDIGISEAGKLTISETPLSGELVLDAAGKVVSPGFIDVLGDNTRSPEKTYEIFEKYKVTDGATVLQMHGGTESAGAITTALAESPIGPTTAPPPR
jgi:hypothetical protein